MTTATHERLLAVDRESLERLGFDAARLDRVSQKIREDIETERCHGVNMIVARRGEVVLNITEGYAHRSAGRDLEPDAVFAHMSVAKQFTNILALMLVERGLLKLHAPVAELIPEFATHGKEKVNLWHLLTQTSGVTSAIPNVPPELLMNVERLVEYASGLPLESQPGERVNYSAMVAHAIMAVMCQRVDGRGRSFAEMLDEDLFQPLGMTETSLGARDDLMDRLCPVKAAHDDASALFNPQRMEKFAKMIAASGAENPAGGTVGTIGDLHRFAEMLRRGGELDGHRVLSPAMIDFCTRIYTGGERNTLFDMWNGTRNWEFYPANIGVGFFMRGEGNLPGIFSVLNSPRTFGDVGTGASGFTIDPEHELTFSFLSTGLMEDSYHFERMGVLQTMVLAALTDR